MAGLVAGAAVVAVVGCSGDDVLPRSNDLATDDLKIRDAAPLDATRVDAAQAVQDAQPALPDPSDPCDTALQEVAPAVAQLCCLTSDSDQAAAECTGTTCQQACNGPSNLQVCAMEHGRQPCEDACRGASGAYLVGMITGGKHCGPTAVASDASAAPVRSVE